MSIGIGQILGNHRLKSLLGRGGFADVYLAEHIYLGTLVAIKVLNLQLTSDNIELFSKEARTVANLFHPHILRVLDFGIEHGTPYLVMDYAYNGTLRRRHPRGSILQLDTIISYIKQIAPALQYIHESKLIHRDIKPENLLIGRDGEILISDFGIATVAHSTRSLNTEGASGTIYYMAPEQIQGRPRPASDQYALGVLVYEWLCGTPPFTGTVMEIGMQHLLKSPPPLHRKSLMVPYPVEQSILTALAKDPHQRFEDIQAFAHTLEQANRVLPGTPLCVYTGYSFVGPYSEFDELEYGVTSVLWSPDSKFLASVGWKKGVEPLHIWNAFDGVKIKTFRPSPQTIEAVIWKNNFLWIAATEWYENYAKLDVQLINVALDKSITIRLGWRWYNELARVTWSPDGRFIAFLFGHIVYDGMGYDGMGEGAVENNYSYDNIEIRESSTGEKVAEIRFKNLKDREISAAVPFVWSPDSQYIALSLDEKITLWEVTTQKITSSFPVYTPLFDPISSEIAWSPDGRYLAIGDTEVKIFDAFTGFEILTYINRSRVKTKPDPATANILPPGNNVTSAELHIAKKQFDITVSSNHAPPVYNQVEEPLVTAIAWSPDGKHIISAYHHGDADSTVHIWNAMTGENVVTRHTQFGRIVSMDWSPDGRRIAVAFEIGRIEIWCAI